jgi:hypothetical protein
MRSPVIQTKRMRPMRSGWAWSSSKKPVPDGVEARDEEGTVSITGGIVVVCTADVIVGSMGGTVTEGSVDVGAIEVTAGWTGVAVTEGSVDVGITEVAVGLGVVTAVRV